MLYIFSIWEPWKRSKWRHCGWTENLPNFAFIRLRSSRLFRQCLSHSRNNTHMVRTCSFRILDIYPRFVIKWIRTSPTLPFVLQDTWKMWRCEDRRYCACVLTMPPRQLASYKRFPIGKLRAVEKEKQVELVKKKLEAKSLTAELNKKRSRLKRLQARVSCPLVYVNSLLHIWPPKASK